MALTWKSGGAGGDAVLTSDLTVTNPIGKLTQGQTLAAGTTLEYVNREMLMKTSYPTLTNPSVSISWTAPALAKVGSSISTTITSVFSRGKIDPAYGTSGFRSGEVTGFELNGTANQTGEFPVTVTRATKGTEAYQVTASYGAGEQPKDSEGNNYEHPLDAGSVQSNRLQTEFILPFMYGGSDGSDFSGLTEDLTKKGTKTYRVTTNVSRVTFLYDAAYGDLASIKDQNGFENITGFTKSTVTVDGQSYIAYVSQYATTDTNAQYTLSF